MTPGTTEAFATRLSAEDAEQVREALADTDLSRSDFLARAVRYYIDENPDNIPALRESQGPLIESGILPRNFGLDESSFEN